MGQSSQATRVNGWPDGKPECICEPSVAAFLMKSSRLSTWRVSRSVFRWKDV